MRQFQIGDLVRAHYNSGTYIGKIIEDRGERYLIEVLAVHKHPLQGDLHNLNQTEGVAFHERKALAYREKTNVKKPAVHPYDKEIPDYSASLKKAVEEAREKFSQEDTPVNKKSLQCLDSLEKHYYQKIYGSQQK
ncbi:MAG TPA: kinase-associated lipoprotein B [Bacillota bacterium]|nr:kinase-associated lipoprotein B [Bacillota bacterium]